MTKVTSHLECGINDFKSSNSIFKSAYADRSLDVGYKVLIELHTHYYLLDTQAMHTKGSIYQPRIKIKRKT